MTSSSYNNNNAASYNNGNDEVRNIYWNHPLILVAGQDPQDNEGQEGMQLESLNNLTAPSTAPGGALPPLQLGAPLSTGAQSGLGRVVSPRMGPNQEMSLVELLAFGRQEEVDGVLQEAEELVPAPQPVGGGQAATLREALGEALAVLEDLDDDIFF